MSLTKEDLLAIENLLDRKLDAKFNGIDAKFESIDAKFDNLDKRVSNLEDMVKVIKVDLLENDVIPRLSNIEECYTSTYERYRDGAERFEKEFDHIDTMDKTISKHSKQIQELQLKQA